MYNNIIILNYILLINIQLDYFIIQFTSRKHIQRCDDGVRQFILTMVFF